MRQGKTATARLIQRARGFRYSLVWEGIAVGAAAGLVTVLFRLLLSQGDALRQALGELLTGQPWLLPLWLVALLVLAALVTLLLRWEPLISGSGIPQVEGELQGHLSQTWWRVLLAKFVGGLLTIGAGLSLGREGPSIQLGAMAGKGVSRLCRRDVTEERMLLTCGASAGLSAAFNAPLAGVLFSLEELHKDFSTDVLLSTMSASITADFISRTLFGLGPVFSFPELSMMPLAHYWMVLLLGALLGLVGGFYNFCVAKAQDLYAKIPWAYVRAVLPFLLAGVLLVVYPAVLGGGHNLVEAVSQDQALQGLLVLFAVKFLFSMASFGAGVPGGIFLPLLVLGAVTGGVYSRLLENLLGIDGKYIAAFVVLAMAGYFAAIVHAPVTGVVLITEMTGDFRSLLGLVMVSLIAFVISERLGTEPIYTQLMNRSSGKRYNVPKQRKSIIDDIVHPGSIMDGKRIMDMGLPLGALIVSVIREEQEFIPDGHTILRGGDVIEVLLREEDLAEVEHIIEEECKKVRL